jgi:hypothetical protein
MQACVRSCARKKWFASSTATGCSLTCAGQGHQSALRLQMAPGAVLPWVRAWLQLAGTERRELRKCSMPQECKRWQQWFTGRSSIAD